MKGGSGFLSGEAGGSKQTKVINLEQYRWMKSGIELRRLLGAFAADPVFSGDVARARKKYLAGIDPGFIDENEEMILERCFEWFIFDYVVRDGMSPIEIFASRGDLPDRERILAKEWSHSRLSVYEVRRAVHEEGMEIIDLISKRKIRVSNCYCNIAGNLENGSVLCMRVLRIGNEFEFSTGGPVLPAAGRPLLLKKIKADIRKYSADKVFDPDTYLRERAHRINAIFMDLVLKSVFAGPARGGKSKKPVMPDKLSSHIAQQITDAFLDDYYEKWVNQPVKDFDGKTPREMCKTVHGRARVEELLNELEKMESERIERGEPHYDINKVRSRLGVGSAVSTGDLHVKQSAGSISKDWKDYQWFSAPQARVASLINESLEAGNYTRDQVRGSIKLWYDFCVRENPRIRKEEVWVAAVVYTFGRIEFDGKANQHRLAGEYKVSPSSLSEKYRQICRALDLMIFDPRYTPGGFPVERVDLSGRFLAKILYDLKL
ncbi:MAG: antitoxin Xre/MbcA/ParS toxin-binding domain-containing protein [Bacillota bacterium]